MSQLNELSYLNFGDDFVTTNGIIVRNPLISEIKEIGEFRYLTLVNMVIMRPYDDMVNLWDSGIDYEEITDYEIFMRNTIGLPKQATEILFGDLDFSKMRIIPNPSNGNPVMSDGKIIIDEMIYNQIVDFIRFIHFIDKESSDEIKPGNLGTKKYLIKRMRRKQEKNAKKPPVQHLSNIISSLVNDSNFPYNYSTVRDLHIGQLYNSFYRIVKHDNSNYIKQAIYGGTISSKDIDNSVLEWFGTIAKHNNKKEE